MPVGAFADCQRVKVCVITYQGGWYGGSCGTSYYDFASEVIIDSSSLANTNHYGDTDTSSPWYQYQSLH